MNTVEDFLPRTSLGRQGLKALLPLAGIGGPVILVICDLIVGLSVPGYSFLRDSISDLAWTPFGWIQTLGFISIGLLTEVFVAALYLNIKRRIGFIFGIGLLACLGFGLLIIGVCHTDPVVGPHTLAGAIHGQAAKYTLWLFPFATLLMTPTLWKNPYWKPICIYSIAEAVFAIGFMIGNIWRTPDFGWYGLFERVLVGDELIWLVVLAIWLARSLGSGRRGKRIVPPETS
jgi:hypothetical membrane protein